MLTEETSEKARKGRKCQKCALWGKTPGEWDDARWKLCDSGSPKLYAHVDYFCEAFEKRGRLK
jgi:hypothetical protein